ncbi:MAG: hypothetical protein LPK19_15560 [Hymenobacteraceae bacterium]|nr:hypothetical protein [Hymenobacteraceae bacterium]MDX5397656.1 hypothetical protein [Hymenobacteraceae bacterium]MDX5513733.1 hypothetical protein [Hymenobacteraceae bacterium]
MKNILKTVLLTGVVASMSLQSCYYDVESELYPPPACDTTVAVTYQNDVLPIVQNNCYVCHSQANGANNGNVVLEGHSNLSSYALSGKLYGVISHAPGFSAMPKGGNKLPDCDIQKIKKWIDSGALNN